MQSFCDEKLNLVVLYSDNLAPAMQAPRRQVNTTSWFPIRYFHNYITDVMWQKVPVM